MGIDDVAGNIVVGKSADLIVLDQNIFDRVPGSNLHKTQVLVTLIEGQLVWDPESLLGAAEMRPVWSEPLPEV